MSEPRAPLSSPNAAYRADMSGRATPFGEHDDAWIQAASVLHLASTSDREVRKSHLYDALGLAIDLLGDERIDAMVEREWLGERCYVESMVVLADAILQAGALRLAAVMLDDLLLSASDLAPIEEGRIRTLRARVEWKMGNLEGATARYEFIASMGEQERIPELIARAETGFAAIAQLRGNFPAVRRHADRAVNLAEEHGLPSIARLAHHGLTIVAAKLGDYDEALIQGLRMLQLSGDDQLLEAEALQNLGQLMLESAHADGARACFAGVMSREAPARILLPALSGLALASARLGNEATVEWSVREVWRALDLPVPRFELSEALLECAVALRTTGRADDSSRYRDAAIQIANAEGFNELVFRAGDLDAFLPTQPSTPGVLRLSAARVASQLSAYEPEGLPTHVEFGAAPV